MHGPLRKQYLGLHAVRISISSKFAPTNRQVSNTPNSFGYRAYTRGDRVAATVGTINAATIACMYTRGDCRGDRRGRDDCRNSRPVYTLQAIVTATNTCLIEQPSGDCRGDDRRDDHCNRLHRRSPRVYALLDATMRNILSKHRCW